MLAGLEVPGMTTGMYGVISLMLNIHLGTMQWIPQLPSTTCNTPMSSYCVQIKTGKLQERIVHALWLR